MNQEFFELAIQAGTDPDKWIELFDRGREFTAAGVHNVRLVDIGPETVELTMPIGDHARQPYGLLHGGVSMMLAETAASMHSCWGVDLTESVPVGIEINGSHVDSARDGQVRAVGTVIDRGRSLIHHRVEIIHADDDRLLSEVRVTNFYKSIVEGQE